MGIDILHDSNYFRCFHYIYAMDALLCAVLGSAPKHVGMKVMCGLDIVLEKVTFPLKSQLQ